MMSLRAFSKLARRPGYFPVSASPTFYKSSYSRSIHQEFAHDRDIPIHQVPSLGDGDYTGKELNEEHWDNREFRVNNRHEDKLDMHYVNHGQDFPNAAMNQNPEQFLPEDPGFFEFWGYSPFMFFGAAICFSKELFLGPEAFAGHVSWLALPCWTAVLFLLMDNISKTMSTLGQFREDQDALGVEMMRRSIEKNIDSLENELKTKERNVVFAKYVQALNERKVAYFAHVREKTFATDILRRLKLVSAAERSFQENVKTVLMKDAVDHVTNAVSKDKVWQKSWNDRVLKAMTDMGAGKEAGFENTTVSLYTDYLTKRGKEMETNADKKIPIDRAVRQLLDAVHSATSTLKVYSGSKEKATDYVPRLTGQFGDLSAAQQKTFPTKAELKKRSLELLATQTSRFQANKVPLPLSERKKTIESS